MKPVNLDASIDSLELAARGIMAEVDRLRKQNAALVQALQDAAGSLRDAAETLRNWGATAVTSGVFNVAAEQAEKVLSDSKAGGQ